MNLSTNNSTVTAAIITAIGAIIVALIAKDWTSTSAIAVDNKNDTVQSKQNNETKNQHDNVSRRDVSLKPVNNIIGTWYDATLPQNTLVFNQSAQGYSFTGQGMNSYYGTRFQSNGNASLNQQNIQLNYWATYNNGGASSGTCQGMLSNQMSRLNMSCNDNALGYYQVSLVKR